MSAAPIVGVGLVLIDGGRVLLVRRKFPPRAGEWSLPGGKQRAGETVRAAALRELLEETGLAAEILGLIDVVDAAFTDRDAGLVHYTLISFAARRTRGVLRAGSDAADVAWHAIDNLRALGVWDETRRVIEAARRFFAG